MGTLCIHNAVDSLYIKSIGGNSGRTIEFYLYMGKSGFIDRCFMRSKPNYNYKLVAKLINYRDLEYMLYDMRLSTYLGGKSLSLDLQIMLTGFYEKYKHRL